MTRFESGSMLYATSAAGTRCFGASVIWNLVDGGVLI